MSCGENGFMWPPALCCWKSHSLGWEAGPSVKKGPCNISKAPSFVECPSTTWSSIVPLKEKGLAWSSRPGVLHGHFISLQFPNHRTNSCDLLTEGLGDVVHSNLAQVNKLFLVVLWQHIVWNVWNWRHWSCGQVCLTHSHLRSGLSGIDW